MRKIERDILFFLGKRERERVRERERTLGFLIITNSRKHHKIKLDITTLIHSLRKLKNVHIFNVFKVSTF